MSIHERSRVLDKLFLWPVFVLAITIFAFFSAPSAFGVAKVLDVHRGYPDYDSRAGQKVPPSGQALSIVSSLGAQALWNSFGTPESLIKYGGYLATGYTGNSVNAARNWIRANKALFRLSDQAVTNLELLNDSVMSGSSGHAVVFRQKFGNLPSAQDGLITVGIISGKIAYVSSSAVGDQAAPGAPVLTPTAAWLVAAADVGRTVSANNVTHVKQDNSWTIFGVDAFSHIQRARLVGFPTTTSVRPAFETIVLDVQGGNSTAYTHFIDAQTGQVLFRQNQVEYQQAPQSTTFSGSYAPPACGPFHGPFNVPNDGFEYKIGVSASSGPATDIVLELHKPQGTVIANADTLFSPETIVHPVTGGAAPGDYYVRVCPFSDPGVAPYTYVGDITIIFSGTSTFKYPPKWKFFPANPKLSLGPPSPDLRNIGCWSTTGPDLTNPVGDCQLTLENLAARAPWDHDILLGPTFTTKGNQANSAESWTSFLTPGPLAFRPVKPDRIYYSPYADTWRTNKCDPTVFLGGPVETSNDLGAATTNLFTAHNRMHDWAYFLGFTERNFNLQENNFGLTAPGPFPLGREKDPETGNVQAGAATGGPPSFLGRDNANQITLNDGIPGITNMYLWQPIAAGFYPPCVDGDFDMSVIGHEYTHAISNRMIGGPDANITSQQGGSMGESWSDLAGVEILNEYTDLVDGSPLEFPVNGEHAFSLGSYVTGNKERGIRNYNMSRNLTPPFANGHQQNPLNYSDVGYDFVCEEDLLGTTCVALAQVHADGEIWSATNYDIRQALVTKYNGSFPASNTDLQRDCANGVLLANQCPGNRRWIQIVFDAFLLMPPNVSMLSARNAYLGADMMRFAGANQKELWLAFARRGMGQNASTVDGDDVDPKPNFQSPLETEKAVTFQVLAADEGNAPINNAKIFVGHYEARITPIADTIPGGSITNTANIVTGRYDFIVQAPGYGHFRFTRFFTAGGSLTLNIFLSTNRASATKFATASGTGSNQANLIDDTEVTNWSGGPVAAGQHVIVDLQGGLQTVDRVNVSAMLEPFTGGRFTALRKFQILTCNANIPASLNCINPAVGYTSIFTSADNAFPAGAPRPTAPDLIIRSFNVPNTSATHVMLKVLSNQCTQAGTPFQGDQDNDPLNDTDCDSSTSDNTVRAAELQVFSSTPAPPPIDPAVLFTMTAPLTAKTGTNITYQMSYNNLGPGASSNAKITNVLPGGLNFVSATNGGVYNAATRTVTWNLGTVPVGFSGSVNLTAQVAAPAGSIIVNTADYTADLTVATPSAAVTTVLP